VQQQGWLLVQCRPWLQLLACQVSGLGQGACLLG